MIFLDRMLDLGVLSVHVNSCVNRALPHKVRGSFAAAVLPKQQTRSPSPTGNKPKLFCPTPTQTSGWKWITRNGFIQRRIMFNAVERCPLVVVLFHAVILSIFWARAASRLRSSVSGFESHQVTLIVMWYTQKRLAALRCLYHVYKRKTKTDLKLRDTSYHSVSGI